MEHVFSRGHILLFHLHNQLSAQIVQALLCLGEWSYLNLVDDSNVYTITNVSEDKSEKTMEEWHSGWN